MLTDASPNTGAQLRRLRVVRIVFLSQLINLGADVHYVGWKPDGGSALHEAVRNQCSTGLVETLLRRGVSPLVKNASGFTALDYAIQGKDTCLVRKLEDFADFTGYLEVKVSSAKEING